MWTYLFLIWQLSLLSLYGICVWLCIISYSLFIQPSTTYFGCWRYFWMDGGNLLCIHSLISISLLCIDGWHMNLIVTSFIYAFIMHLTLLYHIIIYACVKGELHLKSLPKICVITLYVLSSSKRGRLLAQRPLALSFDDNKPYVVRY